ncbi:hypothetical protein NE237_024963 [Protea cynaroides]|uniref:FAR1 domain-containing protein n=1 Tax=Protea cynaroides TaxID=273540 RepID=A0A9Q0H584_9MAGN|nr:hypothetical protein NE237_024963 [Protea cynaroides]
MCFSIRKDYANWRREPNKSKKVLTLRMFACNKGGVRKADKRDIHTVLHREETRIGCPAKIGLIWQLLKLPICHLLRHHWIIQTLRCSLSNPQEQWSIILHPNKFW